ncbi:MAG TPA: AMIN domain-containing protein [Verrucomicrobiae bacterium]|nr:AMIN domain-containing protein [Verrucomicrobiae bacterium]
MTVLQRYAGSLLLLLSCAVAQEAGPTLTVKQVTAWTKGNALRVEVTLTGTVNPSVANAFHPDRLLLDFPQTVCSGCAKSIETHAAGVRRVRIAQHSIEPPVTRLVLEMDHQHPYALATERNKVILVVTLDGAEGKASKGAPAAATSGNLIGVFRRRREPTSSVSEDDSADNAPPAPGADTAPGAEPSSGVSEGQRASEQQPATAGSAGGSETADNVPPFAQTQVIVASGAKSPRQSLPAAVPRAAPALISSEPSANTTAAAEAEPAAVITRPDDPSLRTVFRVKYVAEGVAYLDGGRAQGLTEGMKLEVEDSNLPARQGESVNATDPRVVAELQVSAVAETSAITDIHVSQRAVKVGDLAYLSSGDAEALIQQRALSATRQYPAVISFTEGDPLDEEVREQVPRPPLPSVNRARGRIGFDSIETISHGSSTITSTDAGMVFRGDITRIGGTYWNLSGYWRGELTKESAASQQTLQSLMNRTYHLNLTYDNPNSTLVAGFGRLYLPWAPSLDTIDGGYVGKRLSPGTTLGVFGGSTPDPSSWDYSPDRAMGGTFINFTGGQYDGFHYSSTAGAGISMLKWAINDPFIFFEDSLSYRRTFAVYESAQFDSPKGNSVAPAAGAGLGRNFFTLRLSPQARVELDVNYNYFREIPTFDPTLVGTSLLDQYLFQGFSAGGRVEVWKQVWISTNLGKSSGSGDAKSSLNEMYGITIGRLPFLNLRADAHYTRFNGSFGNGAYEALSLSRQMSDRLQLEVLVGQQDFNSGLTANNRARFLTGTVETTIGPHYYLQSSFTTNRGDLNYDQMMFSVGYRFDSKRRGE